MIGRAACAASACCAIFEGGVMMNDAKKLEILDTVERDAWATLDVHKQAVHFDHRIAALQAIFHCMAIRVQLRVDFGRERSAGAERG
jgi:hypothetical protein